MIVRYSVPMFTQCHQYSGGSMGVPYVGKLRNDEHSANSADSSCCDPPLGAPRPMGLNLGRNFRVFVLKKHCVVPLPANIRQQTFSQC